MTAPLRRRIALLEAKLAAETAAHEKTFGFYRDQLHEIVELKLRNEAALAALAGADYFGSEA
jgi:hypothetical protein